MHARTVYLSIWFCLALLSACSGLTEAQRATFENGVAAVQRSDWSTAQELLTPLIEEQPGYAPLYLWRGRAHLGAENYVAAAEDLRTAVQSDTLEPHDAYDALVYSARVPLAVADQTLVHRPEIGTDETVRQRREARALVVSAGQMLKSAPRA